MPQLEPVEISAGALHLRPWRPADADAVYQACQDAEIQRWTRVPSPYTRADADEFVRRTAPAGWARGTSATFAVVDATTGGLLAAVGLDRLSDDHLSGGGNAEIGFWCAAEHRGKGVTTRAVGTVARWAFGALGVQRLGWYAEVGNWPSRRVAEKSGFTIEGTLRRWATVRGRRVDCWVGSRLPEDPAPVR
jgi:RimJ/RimL family protein N-acetyltransferase